MLGSGTLETGTRSRPLRDGDSGIPTIWGQISWGGNDPTTNDDSLVKNHQVTDRRE